jgi:hypothetical protein
MIVSRSGIVSASTFIRPGGLEPGTERLRLTVFWVRSLSP